LEKWGENSSIPGKNVFLFLTLPVYKNNRLASADRRLMSKPSNRLWRWDLRQGIPVVGDSGHFYSKKSGVKIHQILVKIMSVFSDSAGL
jgi:hypothetical protein